MPKLHKTDVASLADLKVFVTYTHPFAFAQGKLELNDSWVSVAD